MLNIVFPVLTTFLVALAPNRSVGALLPISPAALYAAIGYHCTWIGITTSRNAEYRDAG